MADISTAIVSGSAAVLSACIALSGVYFGQLLQGRRERKQRAEQWKREDRHRFTEHKRQLYADSLALLYRWSEELDEIIFLADISIHELIDEGKEPPKNLFNWLKKHNQKNPIRYRTKSDNIRQQVHLVAPQEIYSAMSALISDMYRVTEFLVVNAKPNEAYDRLRKTEKPLNSLTDLMRSDLTETTGQL